MRRKISKLELGRRKGENQVDGQRSNILDAAEKLFLEKGLENTAMSDIAAEAGLSRVSLYRYFPDQHPIAFEIAVRMLKRIFGSVHVDGAVSYIELYKKSMLATIDQFYELREAFQFVGMFDHLYGASYPNDELAAWYKQEIQTLSLAWGTIDAQGNASDIMPEHFTMVGNCVMSFLQKLAVRGELMAEEQGVSLDTQLELLKEMVNVYFDHLAETRKSNPI